MKKYDTIIVGGGPSGMTAALWCARDGQRVLLMDRCDRIGKKILVTGNGKCNLTNFRQSPDCYRSETPEAAAAVLSAFGQEDAMELFRSLGILTRDRDGYVYPYNEQAASVRAAFESAVLNRDGLEVLTETSVTGIRRIKDGFQVSAEAYSAGKKGNAPGRQFFCRSLLIATGGLAGVKLGCDGSGYGLAKALGHHIIPPLPALTALKSSAPFLKKLSGVRNQAAITLLVDGRDVCRERGELQWTDYGISGVAIFQISRFAILALEEGKAVQLSLDFMPEYSAGEVESLLHSGLEACPYKSFEELLGCILPAKLVPVVLREASLPTKQGEPNRKRSGKADDRAILREKPRQAKTRPFSGGASSAGAIQICHGEASNSDLKRLAEVIKGFSLRISGYMGYEKAQVTRGGVDMTEVTEHLESRICPGLFFAGEVLDVDGTCGGYNLQWAFSSGSVAGEAAWNRNRRS